LSFLKLAFLPLMGFVLRTNISAEGKNRLCFPIKNLICMIYLTILLSFLDFFFAIPLSILFRGGMVLIGAIFSLSQTLILFFVDFGFGFVNIQVIRF
jgi:hypothetical protein